MDTVAEDVPQYFTHADVDYAEVAELIARQLLAGADFHSALETLERDTRIALEQEQRSFEAGTGQLTRWQVPYAAAKVLRHLDERLPAPSTSLERQRVTEAELRDPSHATERGRLGSDATNAAIAAEVLAITPGLWHSVALVVVATDAPEDAPATGGFVTRLYGPTADDGYVEPNGTLRILVARRFEMMEHEHGQPWRGMEFIVRRAGTSEWQCEVRYEF